MEKGLYIVLLITLFISCTINPNKEERIQNLEKEIVLTTIKVTELQNVNKTLEIKINQLEARVDALETP